MMGGVVRLAERTGARQEWPDPARGQPIRWRAAILAWIAVSLALWGMVIAIGWGVAHL
jgi:hypothetical protein